MALIILKDLVKEPEVPKEPVKSFLEIIREAKNQVKETPVPKEPVKPLKSFLDIVREAKGVTEPVEPVANPRPEVVEVPAVVISQGAHSRPRPAESTPVDQPIVEQLPQNDDHHVLIVNGQAKKVGKKSQYLLDMLTIET
jgi:hypothetical protein